MVKNCLLLLMRHRWAAFLIAVVVAGLGLFRGTNLPLRLSLSDLLPEESESVKDLNAVSQEVGGDGYFIVLLGPTAHPEKYLPVVKQALLSYPEINYVFYQREEFLLRDKYFYMMENEDFDQSIKAVKTILLHRKGGLFDIGLLDENEDQRKRQEAKDFLASLKNRVKTHSKGPAASEYFLSNDEHYAIVLAKASFDAGNLDKSAKLGEFAKAALEKALPKEVPFRLVGRYVDKVNDTRQIQSDIAKTGLICFIAIFVFIFAGFGSLRVPVYSLGLVTISMGWTMGFAQVMVGQINILTGFLLAILGGLGVEYGVHLFRRYYQERAHGGDHERAFTDTYLIMGRTLGSSAVTSSLAFLILSFSDFRGFSELGKIAGVGILSVYCVFMLCFPLLGSWLRPEPRFGKGKDLFGYYPVTTRWVWTLVPLVAIVVWGLSHAEFEYNFKRMHNLSKETERSNEMVAELFGKSVSPAAVWATDKDQALAMQKWFQEPQRKEVIDQVVTLHGLVREDQERRRPEIERFRALIKEKNRETVEAETGLGYDEVKRWFDAKPFVRTDLPDQLRDAFGKSGNVIMVYPKKDLDFAAPLREFANVLIEGKRAFPGMRIGSEVTVFVQILDHIIQDGRIVLVTFLLGAFFVIWLDFRQMKDALDLELQLVAGIVLLVGLMGLFGVRFSILNIAMVPAVLAAGIDMGIHVRHRELEGARSLAAARFISHAVHLSALTTVIGFASLFFAEAGILKGIAWISVLGQVSMYLICMVVRPMIRDWAALMRSRKVNAEHAPAKVSSSSPSAPPEARLSP